MSSDFLLAVKTWLTESWNVLTDTFYPGTNLSYAVLLIGPALVAVSISILNEFFELKLTSVSQGGGNNTSIKVSDERKGDSH